MSLITIDSSIRLSVSSLPPQVVSQILAALTIPNPAKETALREKLWNAAQMSDTISLYHLDGDELVLPRGFYGQLVQGLKAYGIEAEWLDYRRDYEFMPLTKEPNSDGFREALDPIVLRDYQEPAVRALVDYEQGIVEAATGCVAGDTKLRVNRAGNGSEVSIRDAYERFNHVKHLDKRGKSRGLEWDRSIQTYCRALVDGIFKQHRVKDIVYSGVKHTSSVRFRSGKVLQATPDHKILTPDGWKRLGDLKVGDEVVGNGQEGLRCCRCNVKPKSEFFVNRSKSRGYGYACKQCISEQRLSKAEETSYQGQCTECGSMTNVARRVEAKYRGLCSSCISRRFNKNGPANPNWKERYLDKNGYVYVHASNHPRVNRHGCVFEHIIVAEKKLGRPIGRHEHVHHINEIKDDNRPENLEVLTPAEHHRVHRGFLKMDGGTTGRGGEIIFLPRQDFVESISDGGLVPTYDMVMESPYNNFVANGIVVHNSGKSEVALEAIRRVDQPALIIVDKAVLAEQWRERIRERLGVEAGYVGESKVDIRPLTVCLRQSLWSRFNELDEPSWSLLDLVEGSFWDLWGVVVFDEVHHLPSDTLQDLSQRFPARHRWGLSATPARDPALWPITKAIVGPILHRTTAQEAGEALVQPSVRLLSSDFEFDYRPTQIVDRIDPETGEVIVSPRTGRPMTERVQNNWTEMVGALCSDVSRNLMIAQEVKDLVDEGRRVLVVSRRKKHLSEIYAAIREVDEGISLLMLVGGMSDKEADDVRQCVHDRPCCLLSTVAEEALDLPKLDAVIIPFPFRNTEILVQIVGRVMRAAPGKKDAIVVDVTDPNVYLLRSQARERAMYYKSSGYSVQEVLATNI